MQILFIDTVHPYLFEVLQKDGHQCIDAHQLKRAEIKEQICEAGGIIIRSRLILDKELLDAGKKLVFIARAGSGLENIDTAYATKLGITCVNSPEGNRDAVGEHVVAMLLALFNRITKADGEVRLGRWEREGNRGIELKQKTVGIIGFGNMGKSFAEKLSGFGCKIMAYDKYLSGFGNDAVEEVSMDRIFEESDILSLHIPLTEETEYLVNIEFINRFRKNFYIINSARGRCLNTTDLVVGLKSGKVRGACLDVLEYEDNSFENFNIRSSGLENTETWLYLTQSEKVIFSPHIAGWTVESKERIAMVLYEKILRLLNAK